MDGCLGSAVRRDVGDRRERQAVASALRSATSFFPDERRAYSRTRQSVIDQNAALQERERHKLASLATILAEALRERGGEDLAATLAAQAGVTVFGIAFGQWIREGEQLSLTDLAAEVLRELLTLTAAATASGEDPAVGAGSTRGATRGRPPHSRP